MPNPKLFVARPTTQERTINFRAALVLTIIAFTILTFFAKQYPYFYFDLPITLSIQRINLPMFNFLITYISFLGNVDSTIFITLIIATYGLIKGGKFTPVLFTISSLGGLGVSVIFKMLVGRPRPNPELIHQVGTFLYSDSFPSGHVLGAVSLYGFLLYLSYTKLHPSWVRKIIMGICILIIFMMGLSRIYLGAHWFSDVLGAYLIGFVWLSGIVFIYHKLHPKIRKEN